MKYSGFDVRMRVAGLLIIIVAVLPVNAQSPRRRALTGREIAQETFPSVVLLVTEDANGNALSLGSGFLVQEDLVATNYHVIKGASNAYAKFVGQKSVYKVKGIAASDPLRDLALLRISGLKKRPLRFADTHSVAVGDDVYVVGNPEGLEGTLSQGIVSGIRQIKGRRYFQITAPISHGSSGGPVLNKQGEVIGIASAMLEEGQNLNFAIPVSFLGPLIEEASTGKEIDEVPSRTANDGGARDRTVERNAEEAELARNYLYQGRAYYRQHRDAEAVEAFRQAIRIKPDYVDAYYYLGLCYKDSGQYVAAIMAMKDAIRYKPNDAMSH